MSKRKMFLFLTLLVSVLLWTSFLMEAMAEDTYNFYFQKAPGPVTVNQGAAVQTGTTPAKLYPGTPPGPAPVIEAAATEPPGIASATRLGWRLALGYSYDWRGDFYTYTYDFIHGQYALGLQYDLSEVLGIEGMGYYIAKPQSRFVGQESIMATGSRVDWSAGAAVTPIRIKEGLGRLRLALSGLAGEITFPHLNFQPDTMKNPEIRHASAFYFGLRASLDLGEKVALQADIRRISKFVLTRGTATLAYLF